MGAEPRARLLSIQDRNGNALSLAYDSGCGAGLLCAVTDGAGRSLTFTYTQGRLTQLSDGSGRVWRYGYDGAGHLVSYQSPLAVSGQHGAVSYAYYTAADGANLAHALKRITKPLGNGMAFAYYADGRAFRHTPFDVKGPRTSEAVTFRYNDFRRETVTTHARGFSRTYRFDAWGNPVRIADEAGAAYSYAYDAAHPYLRRSETDPVGQVTRYAYDGFGNLTQITLPSQRTQPGVNDRVRYTGSSAATFHQPQKIQDARGNTRILRYDARGNLTDDIALKSGLDPVLPYTPEATQIAAWTVYGYDGFGNRTQVKRVRDMAGQIANPAGPTGPTLTTAYDAQGLYPVSVSRLGDQNGDGRIDAADRADFLPLRYDVLGRPRYGLDADWHRTRAAYDADDRLVGATDALGHWREVRYDGNGHPVLKSLTDAGSLTRAPALIDRLTRRYDGADRLEARIDAGGGVTRYTWDEAGNLSQITDPDGHTVRFAYDAADRLIRATDRAGHTVVTERDGAGRIRAVTDPNGNATTYAYWDATRAGRLKTVTLPAVEGYAGGRAVHYDYDAQGHIIQLTEQPAPGSAEAARDTLRTYDALGRLVREAGPAYVDQDPSSATFGQTIRPVTRWVYDPLGHLKEILAGKTAANGGAPIDPDSGASASDTVATQVRYVTDDFGRVLRETDALGQSTVSTYDRHGNVLTRQTPTGHTLTYTWGYGHQLRQVQAEDGRAMYYTRNPLGQITRAETWSASPSQLEVAYDYTYDAAHRLSSVTDSRGSKTLRYAWSTGGLLDRVEDSDGHRVDYLYDPAGRLIQIWAPNYDSYTFAYDAGGRLTELRYPNGVTETRTWNADGSLAQVSHQNGSLTLAQSAYTYDGFGRARPFRRRSRACRP